MPVIRASAQLCKQSCSANPFAFITLEAQSIPDSHRIELNVINNADVAAEVHKNGIPSAILEGISLVVLSQPDRPITGFRVNVIAAKWHPLDSSLEAFKKVACEAMRDILAQTNCTLSPQKGLKGER
jgi:hypothetical protein